METFTATHTIVVGTETVPVMRDPELIKRAYGEYVICHTSPAYFAETGVTSFEFDPSDETNRLAPIAPSASFNVFGSSQKLVFVESFEMVEDIPSVNAWFESHLTGKQELIRIPLSMIEIA